MSQSRPSLPPSVEFSPLFFDGFPYHLVVVVVIATTVVESRLLQAWQQSGLTLGGVPHHSGDANATRADFSPWVHTGKYTSSS